MRHFVASSVRMAAQTSPASLWQYACCIVRLPKSSSISNESDSESKLSSITISTNAELATSVPDEPPPPQSVTTPLPRRVGALLLLAVCLPACFLGKIEQPVVPRAVYNAWPHACQHQALDVSWAATKDGRRIAHNFGSSVEGIHLRDQEARTRYRTLMP